MPVEGISLEIFNALPQTEINSSMKSCPRHAVFHYFFPYGIEQESATTNAHSKRLIELLKKISVIIKYNMGKY